MGKMVLILVLGAGLLFMVVNLNMNRSNTAMLETSYNSYEKVQAKNNASGGLEHALKELSIDTTWGLNSIATISLAEGSAVIKVENTSSKYYMGPSGELQRGRLITAVGKTGAFSDTIRGIIELPSGAGSSVPPFMEYALATGQNMSMNGNVNITDDGNNEWNANVHTNSNFSMNGNNDIDGFLSYGGTAHSNPSWRLNTAITPNVNPSGLDVHSQKPTIEMPTFSAESFKSKATVIENGNKSYSGNISLGTRENPKIVYINGDLTLSGSVTGYGVFIVKGNINLNGNVSITAIDPTGSNLGLYTQGNINANGNVTIKAQIYASQNVNLGGNVKVYGSITSKGSVNFNGNVDIFYRPANEALTNQFWESSNSGNGLVRPSIVSVYE